MTTANRSGIWQLGEPGIEQLALSGDQSFQLLARLVASAVAGPSRPSRAGLSAGSAGNPPGIVGSDGWPAWSRLTTPGSSPCLRFGHCPLVNSPIEWRPGGKVGYLVSLGGRRQADLKRSDVRVGAREGAGGWGTGCGSVCVMRRGRPGDGEGRAHHAGVGDLSTESRRSKRAPLTERTMTRYRTLHGSSAVRCRATGRGGRERSQQRISRDCRRDGGCPLAPTESPRCTRHAPPAAAASAQATSAAVSAARS